MRGEKHRLWVIGPAEKRWGAEGETNRADTDVELLPGNTQGGSPEEGTVVQKAPSSDTTSNQPLE